MTKEEYEAHRQKLSELAMPKQVAVPVLPDFKPTINRNYKPPPHAVRRSNQHFNDPLAEVKLKNLVEFDINTLNKENLSQLDNQQGLFEVHRQSHKFMNPQLNLN